MAKTYLGIDIGHDMLKFALVKGGAVKKTVAVSMPVNLLREGRITSVETLSELISKTMKDSHIRASDAAVILSGSMEPEMSKGDLVLVAETDSMAIGDVVVYQDGSTLILHRIIELDGDTVVTQGDANETADDPISLESVKGKVVFLLPYTGNIVSFLKTPIGIICIIAAAIALLEIPRINEKKKDDEERRQIIEEIERLKEESKS